MRKAMKEISLSPGFPNYIYNEISEEIAKEIVANYKAFESHKRLIKNKIETFKKRLIANNMIEVHASNNNFVVSNTDLQFFQDGYLLINEIRKILGLAPTKYLIGILDMTSDDYKADTIEVTEGIFIRSMRSRGSEKTGLARSDEEIEKLLKRSKKNQTIMNPVVTFPDYLKVLESKDEKLNYGYAFEAWGATNFANDNFSILDTNDRHEAYYKYYKTARKNNDAWVTGGDIGNIQMKLIRIYKDDKGNKVTSSASITSKKTIETTINILEKMLDNTNAESPGRIAYNLNKTFTQLELPKKLTKNLEQKISKMIELDS